MAKNGEMIQDKSGRWIGIHDRPGNWKISAYQRDEMYQRYVTERVAQSPNRAQWIKLAAKALGISSDRVKHIVWQGGSGDPQWTWWVGCSLRKKR